MKFFNKMNNKKIKSFFVISHGLPYIITILLMIFSNSLYINNSFFVNIIYASMLSPLYAALFIIFYFYDKSERQKYLKSIFDFRRISLFWYLFIILFPILIRLSGSYLSHIFTTNNFQFYISPEMTVGYGAFLLLFGPIHEELGWRGVAFPELLRKISFNKSVLSLGFLWAVWHLPLFFIEGTYQNQLGLFTIPFWNFMLLAIFTSVIYGLIYIKTRGSILAVILFHYIGNLSGESLVLTTNADIFTTILRIIIAIIILYYFANTKFKNLNIK